MSSTARLSLPVLEASQAQKHVTVNEALLRLDGVVQLAVADRDRAAPPAAPTTGERHLVAAGATGAWAGGEGTIACERDGAWDLLAPRTGWLCWVEAESRLLVHDGTAWGDFAAATGLLGAADLASGLPLLGVNTGADATNRLAVKADAVLLSHDDVTPGSGDLRVTVNKAASSRDAGFVFQTGWSSRALFGLLGSDDFALKVSPNGSSFVTALSVAAATGRLSLAVDLPISEGGTGASTVARARWNLGIRPNVAKRDHLTGAAWLGSASAADNAWRSVCWSPDLGLFCAVAYSGTGNRVMTSPDGITWTARTSAADNDWRSVCWSSERGLFCAVASSGTGNRVMTSPDGIVWTTRTSAADNGWFSLCWSPERGLFCAIAYSGTGNRVMTSPDGIVWTTRASAADNSWGSVCWSADLGLFCAVANTGTGNRVMTSPDGIVWTIRSSAADVDWYGICWSAERGLFCAVASSGTGNRVMTSPDGVTWTARTSAADNGWLAVCWSAEIGLFCAVANSGTGNRVMTSPDGVTWTARTSAADNDWRAVCWSPDRGLFCAVAISGSGNRATTSVSAHALTYRSS